MENTIQDTLQQGIIAHKQGNFEEAKSFYNKILKISPTHPDANHNLGIIHINSNKGNTALPFFKLAVESSPNEEQFWFSYINALINEKHYNDAINVIKLAKMREFSQEKIDILTERLSLLFYNLGVDFHQKNEIKEAIKYYSLAIDQRFNSPFAHNNLGIIFEQQGRLSEAETSFNSAVILKHDYFEAHNNIGNVYKKQNKLKEAKNSFKQAIIINHEYSEAHNNLGVTLKIEGKLTDAEDCYNEAIKLKPEYADAYYNLGITLQEQGKFEQAELNYKKMIDLNPNFPDVHFNLGIVYQEMKKIEEAEASFNQAILLKPNFYKAHEALLKCLYVQNKKSLFLKELDYLINKNRANAVTGSFIGRSNLKYGVKKHNIFCNHPLKYVLHIDLDTKYNFEKVFVDTSRLILNERKISNRKQPLLLQGYQTSGNIFEIQNKLTAEIQKVIRAQIEFYRNKFIGSDEGIFQKWPDEYELYGWLIAMKSGGELQPHIHEDGWISGSVYINVPSKLKDNSGKLVVSLGEDKDVEDKKFNIKKIIDVVTGSLVLFPGSLTHYTIPFEAKEERIVLAFDAKPK